MIGVLGGGISVLGSPAACAVVIEVCAEISAGVAIGSAITGSSTCGGQSFTADTKVLLASGKAAPISSLKPGDKVLATNTKTGKTQPETVTAVLARHDTDLYDLRVKAGTRTTVIHTTSNHLFWDAYLDRWIPASHLKADEHLKTPDGQPAVEVGGATPADHDGWMWDLTIQDDHDFYIDTIAAPVLVHNCELASTPDGRPYSAHYLNETGPARNIPGSVVDETIDHATQIKNLGDRTVYYDAKNDVTVVESKTTGKIMSVHRGKP